MYRVKQHGSWVWDGLGMSFHLGLLPRAPPWSSCPVFPEHQGHHLPDPCPRRKRKRCLNSLANKTNALLAVCCREGEGRRKKEKEGSEGAGTEGGGGLRMKRG